MERLNSLIRGGELFETILHNPVNIYMTHMSNYANDRLALYTFSSLLDFVQRNTNLQLKYASENGENEHLAPLKLADYYFDLYPIEKQPLWTVSMILLHSSHSFSSYITLTHVLSIKTHRILAVISDT